METANVTIAPVVAIPPPTSALAHLRATGVAVDITLDKNLYPKKEVNLIMFYRDSDVLGFDENKLLIARYNNFKGVWVPLESTPDPANNKVTAKTKAFSIFQIMEVITQAVLDAVRIAPNPFIPSQGHNKITFSNLPPNASITIYSLSGERLAELEANLSGLAFWDGKNVSGNQLASGIYLIYIDSQDSRKILKLAIER